MKSKGKEKATYLFHCSKCGSADRMHWQADKREAKELCVCVWGGCWRCWIIQRWPLSCCGGDELVSTGCWGGIWSSVMLSDWKSTLCSQLCRKVILRLWKHLDMFKKDKEQHFLHLSFTCAESSLLLFLLLSLGLRLATSGCWACRVRGQTNRRANNI